jgi:hypothetical protein
LVELEEETQPRRRAGFRGDEVGTVELDASGDFPRVEAGGFIGSEPSRHFPDLQGMPSMGEGRLF